MKANAKMKYHENHSFSEKRELFLLLFRLKIVQFSG